MNPHPPAVGDWYRTQGGDLFEVVAFDKGDGTIEVQYFDGTVEEMEIDDWYAQYSTGEIETAEAPEDWSGSVDVDRDDDDKHFENFDGDRRLNASNREDLDTFD